MRTYDEPIEVQRGLVAGQEAPEQFCWRGKRWVVRDILAHWVETGAWWEQAGVAALLGVGATSAAPVPGTHPGLSRPSLAPAATGTASGAAGAGAGIGAEAAGSGRLAGDAPLGADLLGERDVWRVEAGRGRPPRGFGVFDLCFDWSDAQWRLVSCAD